MTKAILVSLLLTVAAPAFADDTLCLTVHPAIDEIATIKRTRIERLEDWCHTYPKRHPVAYRRANKVRRFTNKWVIPAANLTGNGLQIARAMH